MRIIEIQHFQVTEGNLEPKLFAAMEYRIKEMGNLPGVRQWWAGNKEQYNAEFIEYVELMSQFSEG